MAGVSCVLEEYEECPEHLVESETFMVNVFSQGCNGMSLQNAHHISAAPKQARTSTFSAQYEQKCASSKNASRGLTN